MLRLIWLYCCLFSLALSATELPIEKYSIKGLDSALEENVLSYLSDTLQAEPSPYLKQHIELQTKQALKALGYYQPRLKTKFVSKQSSTVVELEVDRGPATRIAGIDVTINGPAQHDPEFMAVVSSLPLVQGQVLDHSDYNASKDKVRSVILELGYFDAKWAQSELAVTLATNSAQIVLHLESGVRYKFGPVQVKSETPAGDFIRGLQPFKLDDPYKADKLAHFNLELGNTPYFKSVRVHADVAKRANGVVPVVVEILHKPANSYEIGGGFSTDLGAKARFKWSRPWHGERGHYIDSNLEISEIEKEIRFSYTVPVDNPINDVWRYVAGYQREDNQEINKTTEKLTTQIQRQWLTSDNWVRTAFLKYEREDFTLGEQADKTEMLLPGVSYARKKARGGMTPYWGQQLNITLEAGTEKLISSTDLLKVQLQTALLRTYDTRHLFYTRATLGAILVDDISSVPVSMRFFAGGDQSIRGFQYESVSPRENDELVGGRYLTTGTLEYNYQFAKSWRAAIFVDAGTATNDFSEDLSVGAGVGLRWLTPVGPIRIDTAWAVSDPDKPARLSITIGPEI
ncbi:autotransporter assembly complex protein TamA [Pseudoalteromonas ulvae]|uniref:Translocation and assembly module subunit TamA n=1 Tax=Pseudoalteromonas ulvae TaxID=107327 RepID=A0A244CRQ4_PSEDV|nr:autotransporter assembly complex family protein [Pseudoalteromonas ulvae]OUL58300.1 hypothetical protein B1199_08160 [Pseudoalteromonas ulvae]